MDKDALSERRARRIIVRKNVERERILAGLSGKAFAEKVRVTEACAQQWRTQGLDRAPNGETLQGIADLFGKPVSWFYVDHDTEGQSSPSIPSAEQRPLQLSPHEAKLAVAAYCGVRPEQVEIIVRS